MPYYKFGPDDIFHNRIKAHPKCEFFVYDSRIYYNQNPNISGSRADGASPADITHAPDSGFVSLYEINIDRNPSNLIYPFVTKDGTLTAFKSVSVTTLNATDYGDEFQGTYPQTASIKRELFTEGKDDIGTRDYGKYLNKSHLVALKNTFNEYTYLSPHYEYDADKWNKGQQALNLISIPSIFYGSSIKKGTVDLKFFITGTLVGQLADEGKNGELVQVGPPGSDGSGSIAGVVLYNEGFLALTGAWSLNSAHTEQYVGSDSYNPKWLYFGVGAQDGKNPGTVSNSSFNIAFSGTNHIPTLTMLAHAPRGKLNHSNNPTYVDFNSKITSGSSQTHYNEPDKMKIKNIVSSSHCDHTASFQKQTFISQIGLYDDEKNLIAIAKLARPIRKKLEDDFIFKLKLDF
jgi:hypothetical protein